MRVLHRLVVSGATGFLIAAAAGAWAQATPIHPADTSALHPPAGAKVAIVEFADLECPMCAHENPVILQAEEHYHIPRVWHDFPIPNHNWSFQAAVNARYFDTKSKKLGDDYRNAVFAAQMSIETKGDLQEFTQRFAQQHGTAMPFVIDPQGTLTAEVKADAALGDRMGVHETPTAFVVTAHGYKQVLDFNKLFSMLDEAEGQ
jgi:protein-disulfide isomerase